MKSNNQTVIAKTIGDVKARYPFPAIIDETADTIKFLASALKRLVPGGGRLLDVGCGALDKTLVFQELGYDCYACDDFEDPWYRSIENLNPVLDFAKEAGIQVHVQGQDHAVPWDEGSFDVVTIINVIEHIHESPRKILNFTGKYLKTDGLLLVAMPNSVNLRKRLSVLMGRSNYTPAKGFYENEGSWRGHVREFTFEETCDLVEWTGFQTVYKRTFHGMLNRRLSNPLLRAVFKGVCLPAPGLRDSLLVGARKPAGWMERHPDPEAMERSLTASWLGKQG